MQPVAEEDGLSQNSTPAAASRSRQRRSTPSDSEQDGEAENEDTSQQQMVKNLVRLALAHEHTRKPVHRTDISKKVLSQGSRAFKSVFDAAQLVLRSTFGMELVELPAKEKVTLKDKRAAQKSQSQANANASSKQWILCSVLPQEYRDLDIIGPARAPTAEAEGAYTGLYSFIVSTITLSGGQLPQARLGRILQRMNADQNVPIASTEDLLKKMEKQGYIVKITEQQGGEDVTDYIVGPRGKTEVGSDGVAGLVRRVYGQSAPEDIEQRLARSLKVRLIPYLPYISSAELARGYATRLRLMVAFIE